MPSLTDLASFADRVLPAYREPARYATSETVRNFLVLHALSGDRLRMPSDLRLQYDMAFTSLIKQIHRGTIRFDYRPFDRNVVDIPTTDHAHYMQALLFWCARFRCRLPHLVEAHARCGARATSAYMRQMLQAIASEEAHAETRVNTTRFNYVGPRTMPLHAGAR